MTHLSSNISHSIHSFSSLMASENLRQSISHWLRLSGTVIHMSRGSWMNGLISPAPLLTVCAYGCMRVFLRGDWMAVPRHIVELEGSSSYTLIMALRWRIPEASSLIDSSVPFLPRPRWAESSYCPTTRCTQASKQPSSHSPCTVCTDGLRAAAKHTWAYRKNMLLIICSHNIGRFFTSLIVLQLFPQFALQP